MTQGTVLCALEIRPAPPQSGGGDKDDCGAQSRLGFVFATCGFSF